MRANPRGVESRNTHTTMPAQALPPRGSISRAACACSCAIRSMASHVCMMLLAMARAGLLGAGNNSPSNRCQWQRQPGRSLHKPLQSGNLPSTQKWLRLSDLGRWTTPNRHRQHHTTTWRLYGAHSKGKTPDILKPAHGHNPWDPTNAKPSITLQQAESVTTRTQTQ